MSTKLVGQPLEQMRRPKNSQLVPASEIQVDDIIWAMSAGRFRILRVAVHASHVELRSENFRADGRGYGYGGTKMILGLETKLVRLI